MEHFITKEFGVGWQESLEPAATAWGASQSQHRLAKRVATGDVLMHYIDYAHAWAGFSTVTGELQENQRDSHADWLAALPYAIPIERGVWLNEGQCELTSPQSSEGRLEFWRFSPRTLRRTGGPVGRVFVVSVSMAWGS